MNIHSIWHFPIKGVGGCQINHVPLSVGQVLPGDRRYALSAGSTKAGLTNDNKWLQKAHFLQLMRTEALAALRCRLDDDRVIIEQSLGKPGFCGQLTHPDDRARCQSYISNFLRLADPSKIRVHQINNGAYTDQSAPLISIGGTESLAAFAGATGTTTDPRRFRLNIILHTDTPFVENQWLGSFMQIGDAVIKIVDHVGRCAAINVNPATAKREPDHLNTMRNVFGHSNLGIFGLVVKPGKLSLGNRVSILD